MNAGSLFLLTGQTFFKRDLGCPVLMFLLHAPSAVASTQDELYRSHMGYWNGCSGRKVV